MSELTGRVMINKTWYNLGNNYAGRGLQSHQLCTNEVRSMSPNSTTKTYHGTPCRKRGHTLRYASNGHCVECQHVSSTKWAKSNPDKRRKSSRKWDKNHPEQRSRISKAWRTNNPEKYREIYSNWQSNNLDKHCINQHRRRARKRNAKSEPYDFKAICEHYGNRCLACGISGPLTVDHVIPLALGGNDISKNIQPLCARCNSSKGAKTIDYRPDMGPSRWVQRGLFL